MSGHMHFNVDERPHAQPQVLLPSQHQQPQPCNMGEVGTHGAEEGAVEKQEASAPYADAQVGSSAPHTLVPMSSVEAGALESDLADEDDDVLLGMTYMQRRAMSLFLEVAGDVWLVARITDPPVCCDGDTAFSARAARNFGIASAALGCASAIMWIVLYCVDKRDDKPKTVFRGTRKLEVLAVFLDTIGLILEAQMIAALSRISFLKATDWLVAAVSATLGLLFTLTLFRRRLRFACRHKANPNNKRCCNTCRHRCGLGIFGFWMFGHLATTLALFVLLWVFFAQAGSQVCFVKRGCGYVVDMPVAYVNQWVPCAVNAPGADTAVNFTWIDPGAVACALNCSVGCRGVIQPRDV